MKTPSKPGRNARPERPVRPSPHASRKTAGASPAAFAPKRILLPTDFSECSGKALQSALTLARQFNAHLVLLHVVEAYPIDYLLGLKSAEAANDWMLEQSRTRLRQLARQWVDASPVSAESVVRFGKPVQEICEAARETNADLIVIGTHGHTGLKHIQLGSVAERVVRYARCPVLVVRKTLP